MNTMITQTITRLTPQSRETFPIRLSHRLDEVCNNREDELARDIIFARDELVETQRQIRELRLKEDRQIIAIEKLIA